MDYAHWLGTVGRYLRDYEGDHMVASTILVKRLATLARRYAEGAQPAAAAWEISTTTRYVGAGDYERVQPRAENAARWDVLRAVADPIRLADLAATAVNEVKHLVTTGEIIPRQHPDNLAM